MTKKIIVFVSLFLIFVFLVLFIFWRGIYTPLNPQSQETKIFAIKKGEGSKEIAANLEREGLIRWAPFFRIYVINKGVAKNLQAGQYQLSFAMSIPEMVKKFVSGDVIKEKITIIEGWNLKDVAQYFEQKSIAKSEDFFQMAKKDFSNEFSFLEDKPTDLDLEGYFFPDTYLINKEVSLEEIFKKVLSNFEKKLTPELKSEINRQNKTIFEIVTMASLIEKEVKTFEDKKLVSGILWKRLEVKMPLQVDATISYITGKKTTKISIEETQIDSPYNTYKYQDLPKGPICNPGLESIISAIYPQKSDYWYYLSTPEGKTIFSKTLQEHNIAKAKYLR